MDFEKNKSPRFLLGTVLATAGALELIQRTNTNAVELLMRHVSGDWGVVCETDALLNDLAAAAGERVLSSYEIGPNSERIWVITEADRSATTLLLPQEY
ncbi:hypothetical protein PCA31118_05091 [Pandoraea captiosa]|uniref:Type I restriction endonuclease subunit M n=1 Tax=Pandoraea captiosa TaxID=2508302 RepID=A0A5E5AUU5_9BURK|nr:hypothetical protein [Pandoraea captiosa]VVE75910.1 hypothetical protein PCA31118_05091 [Pandoraea captiosa]